MQFSRLRLSGFKSFVDPTELPIQPGLTGVVGPNGCGKSNLLEALRWVMGENRPTAMRGSGMEDVIFNGSGRRPPKANAEVVLGVDNSERTAPAGFNDADMLDVSRKLTRDLGSSYKINGKEVRARDVQMLFADASTGAHSPALVRQGQIAELIAAKPRARRRVLEEAAGIAGLYQRRHEAELRLNGTESNLARVADTLDQLSQQLVVLQRQARQAARYREIAGALRRSEGLFLLRRWSEAEAAKSEALAKLAEAVRATVGATRTSEEASEIRAEAEGLLPARRDEAAIAGALVARVEAERDQLAREEERAQSATRDLMAQMSRVTQDAEREAALAGDAHGTLERLGEEAEALAEATGGEEEALAEASEAAETASGLLEDLETALAEATEAVAALAARREAAEAALASARSDWARAQAFRESAGREAGEAEERLAEALEASEAGQEAHEAAQALLESAEDTVAETETARAEAQEAEAEARDALARARGTAQALFSEANGIERLLARSEAAGEGVQARISVEPGYERALGAALAEDLRLPLAESGSGWRHLPALEAPHWPAGVEPLSAQVNAPEALARRLALIGVVAPERAAGLQAALEPGQRLVSRAGDLWRWDGAVLAAGDAPSAAALRFEQQNRLAALQEALAGAELEREQAEARHEAEAGRLARLTEAERTARDARRHAERRVSEAGQAASRAASGADQARIRLDAARGVRERALQGFEQAGRRLAEAEERQGEAGDLEAGREGLARQRAGVEQARAELSRRRAAFEALRSEFSARHRRLEEARREIEAWTRRAASAGDRVRELERRAEDLAEALETAAAQPDEIRDRRAALDDTLSAALARREAATRGLDEAEAALRAALETERAAEREAGTRREARAAAEARADAARAAAEEAVARIQDERGQSPNELHQSVGADAEHMVDAKVLEEEIARLRRSRDALGAVNLRADEDAKALEEEHGALLRERDDLEQAVSKLRSAIAALNREGRERLLAAFDQVNANFAALFTHLFGGGEARLVLVESDDPLEAGLEILCQPPGKKLSSLSLLSGGEQTLTAMALIFGVFLANPAPICVLDEVDAPLDDANVGRFCDLLDEMTRRTRTRFLTITHNAITMARMDRLFGVTMVEQGVSQLVSVDLRKAEALVA